MGSVSVPGLRLRNAKGTKERLLVTHNGKLYDITEFASKHPGGESVLHDHAGLDVTNTMQLIDPHQHSDQAYVILRDYYVGEADDSQNDLVDWEKPIFEQIPHIGEEYFEWVHKAVDKPLRLFHSDFFEFFSKCPWWLVPLVWFPVTALLLVNAYNNLSQQPEHWPHIMFGGFTMGAGLMPVLYVTGVIMWTLLEYSIHRWVFHMKPVTNHAFFIMTHFILHGQHHKCPMDQMRLVFPTIPAAGFAMAIFGIYRIFWPHYVAMTIMAGTVTGYMFYDLIHYYLHHGGTMKTEYFKSLKKYHIDHHYKHFQSGFGISSKLWDYPFGTLVKITD